MADTTPIYGFPYLELGDSPDLAAATQNLAEAVEGEFLRIGTGVAVHIRTTAGTANFVKPTNPPARVHLVRLWHGGAAGGGAGGTSGQGEGGGGGQGGYSEKWYLDSELAASEPYTVGAGGTGGGATGGSGGVSSFKALTGTAATGGTAMASTTGTGAAPGGRGGTASGGDLNINGEDGGHGRVLSGQAILAGFGGGGTRIPTAATGGSGVGNTGISPAGGGSGAFGANDGVNNGGNGAAGKILIVSLF